MLSLTQKKITSFLEKNGSTCAAELSHALGLTKANIQYHIKQLLIAGQIEILPIGATKPYKRGRPTIYYRRSMGACPSNLSQLTSCLLDQYLIPLSHRPENLQQALKKIAKRLTVGKPVSTNPITNLNFAMHALNSRGYQAHWEAHYRGAQIILKNCPYAEIIDKYPLLCKLDECVLETLTGMPFRKDNQQSAALSRPLFCRFSLEPEPTQSSV